jgi:hypothetical protein
MHLCDSLQGNKWYKEMKLTTTTTTTTTTAVHQSSLSLGIHTLTQATPGNLGPLGNIPTVSPFPGNQQVVSPMAVS